MVFADINDKLSIHIKENIDMLMGIIVGITLSYVVAVFYLYLTSEMPGLQDVNETDR
jgi:tetrahydromethanopterin S-methyltransferase subunit G